MALPIGVALTAGQGPVGTAFAVAPSFLVTAAHVVRDSETVYLFVPHYGEVTGRVCGRDTEFDVALLTVAHPIHADMIASVEEAGLQHVTLPFTASGWPRSRHFRTDPVTISGRVVDVAATIFDGRPAIQLYCHEVGAGLDPHGLSGAPISVIRANGSMDTIGVVSWSPTSARMTIDGGTIFASPLALALQRMSEGLPSSQRAEVMAWRHRGIVARVLPVDLDVRQPAEISSRPPTDEFRLPWTEAAAGGKPCADALHVDVYASRVLVVGAAGMGKSTLLARLAVASSTSSPHVVDLARVWPGSGADRDFRQALTRVVPASGVGSTAPALILDSLDRISGDSDLLSRALLPWPRWTIAARKLADVPIDLRRAADHVVRLTPLDEESSVEALRRWLGPQATDRIRQHLPGGAGSKSNAIYSIPMYLRLIAQAGLPDSQVTTSALMEHFVDSLLGPIGVNANTRCPTGVHGVIGALEGLAFRLTSTGLSYLPSESDTPDATPSNELSVAAEAGLIENSSVLGFVHDLWREYFAAGQLGRAVAQRRDCQEFFRRPWWEPTPWLTVIEGVGRNDPYTVGRWLHKCRPLEALLLHNDLRRDPAIRAHAQATAADARRLGDPLALVRAVDLLDLVEAVPRSGVSCTDDGIPDHQWTNDLADLSISRFPTTNAQWGAYASAIGVSRDAGRAQPTVPVVNVSWHEVIAYCEWLSEQLDEDIRLPTVNEWVLFASSPDESSPYPFGAWRPNIANTRAARLNGPSAVGAFPGSDAPSGASDMVGNVWEWCADPGQERPVAPAKGGSWASYTHHAAIGSTLHLPRSGSYDDVGFRVLRARGA